MENENVIEKIDWEKTQELLFTKWLKEEVLINTVAPTVNESTLIEMLVESSVEKAPVIGLAVGCQQFAEVAGDGDEAVTVDVDPLNRFGINRRINMGAYGGTARASMPPHDWAFTGDINNSGLVDFFDFALWAQDLSLPACEPPSDLDWSGVIDSLDLAVLADDWLERTSWFD